MDSGLMIWHEIAKERPPHGELIWVWDELNNCRFLIRYMGSEEVWLRVKNCSRYPIWAPLNLDNKTQSDGEL